MNTNENRLYDWLKAFGQIIFPNVLTFIGICGESLGWTNIELILKIGTAFIAMWNAIIVIWNKQYYKEQSERLIVADNNKELG